LELLLLPIGHDGRARVRALGSLAPLAQPYWLGEEPIVELEVQTLRHVGATQSEVPVPQFRSGAGLRMRHGFLVYSGGREIRPGDDTNERNVNDRVIGSLAAENKRFPTPTAMALPLTKPVILPLAEERRRHQRVKVNLLGRYMLADRREFPCQVVDMSRGGMALQAPMAGQPGERVIAYVDHLGRLEGKVARTFENGFAMTISATL